jgi:MFS family permease
LGLMVTIFSMVSHGLGRRIAFVSEEDRTEFFKYLFAGYFTYDIALAITKCSALLFFSRVFPRRQNSIWFNMSLYTIHALNAGWLIGIIAGTIWICRPIAKNWIPAMEGECGPPSDLWIGSAVPSAFIDLLILLLPLPKVWSLQLSRVRRFGIIGVFLLGYGVIVVSLGRVITTFKQADAMDADLTCTLTYHPYQISLALTRRRNQTKCPRFSFGSVPKLP